MFSFVFFFFFSAFSFLNLLNLAFLPLLVNLRLGVLVLRDCLCVAKTFLPIINSSSDIATLSSNKICLNNCDGLLGLGAEIDSTDFRFGLKCGTSAEEVASIFLTI